MGVHSMYIIDIILIMVCIGMCTQYIINIIMVYIYTLECTHPNYAIISEGEISSMFVPRNVTVSGMSTGNPSTLHRSATNDQYL